MMDFSAAMAPEMVRATLHEREQYIRAGRWSRHLRELNRARGGRRVVRLGRSAAERRHALFVEGLDAAQKEGITVDAWFGFRFADPELSARAEWAGLVDGRNRNDAWAA
jgi:hypothetical protein